MEEVVQKGNGIARGIGGGGPCDVRRARSWAHVLIDPVGVAGSGWWALWPDLRDRLTNLAETMPEEAQRDFLAKVRQQAGGAS